MRLSRELLTEQICRTNVDIMLVVLDGFRFFELFSLISSGRFFCSSWCKDTSVLVMRAGKNRQRPYNVGRPLLSSSAHYWYFLWFHVSTPVALIARAAFFVNVSLSQNAHALRLNINSDYAVNGFHVSYLLGTLISRGCGQ